ncbi:MAG: VWA domain-containing protein [Candidatus Saganbacteria bacterium]|nr:VWA domain-containing protein [Candidatus Saganbacteria bacterium]
MSKKVFLSLFLLLAVALFAISGCNVTKSDSNSPAPAPSSLTGTPEVGSGGSISGTAGSNAGALSLVVLDSSGNPISTEAYLKVGNISFEVWSTTTTVAQPGSVISLTAPAAGTAQNFSLAMTFDTSGSMGYDGSNPVQPLTNAVTAAATFVDLMAAADELALIEFNSYVYPRTALLPMLAANKTAVKNFLYGFSPSGGTQLYDAIVTAVSTLSAATNPRKAVMAMTDGVSSGTLSTAVTAANNANIPIYSVGFGTGVNDTDLQALADQTGGFYYYAPNSADLTALYTRISQALTNSWTVNFQIPGTFVTSTTYYIKVYVTYTIGGVEYTGSALFTLTI